MGKVLSSGIENTEAFNEYFSSVLTCDVTGCLGRLEEEVRASRSEVEVEKVELSWKYMKSSAGLTPAKLVGLMKFLVDFSEKVLLELPRPFLTF